MRKRRRSTRALWLFSIKKRKAVQLLRGKKTLNILLRLARWTPMSILRFARFKLEKIAPKYRRKGFARRHQIALRAGARCRRQRRRTLEQPDLYPDAGSNVFRPTPR